MIATRGDARGHRRAEPFVPSPAWGGLGWGVGRKALPRRLPPSPALPDEWGGSEPEPSGKPCRA
ncbi:hypothetical protein A33M_0850 [Rhodovulum sp. PH10]|nr:hypothetical protein A33M_0850 [Rhodovulum sp. PH10]